MALGNGAPDIFSSLAGISAARPELGNIFSIIMNMTILMVMFKIIVMLMLLMVLMVLILLITNYLSK